MCGFDDIHALCLDHINDDGGEHRKATSGYRMGGTNFYKYIRKYGYPSNLQVLCANHNLIKEIMRKRAHA